MRALPSVGAVSSPLRRSLTDLLCYLLPIAAYAVPVLLCVELFRMSPEHIHWMVLVLEPPLFVLAFIMPVGLVAWSVRKGIVPGKFPRDTGHAIYSKRRIYGICWTTVFYCKPIYFLVLNSRWLRRLTFSLFGYQGNSDFTVYPDVWIRDLPLLDLGPNVYLSNRCTIGTNICHMNKTISVDRISIGANAVIGHLAMIAHGSRIGNFSEVGVACGVGINVEIGDHVHIGPMCMLNHYARIGDHVRVGTRCYVGAGARIADGTTIPPGTVIPDRAIISSEEDVHRYLGPGCNRHTAPVSTNPTEEVHELHDY